jgi:hypothetical protein
VTAPVAGLVVEDQAWRAACIRYGRGRSHGPSVPIRDPSATASLTKASEGARREQLRRLSAGALLYVDGANVWLRTPAPTGADVAVRRRNLAAPLGPRLARVSEATFSPDGLRVAFTTATAARAGVLVCFCYVDGSQLCTFTPLRWPFYYVWSPDGRYLTWLSNSPNDTITFRVRAGVPTTTRPAADSGRSRPPSAQIIDTTALEAMPEHGTELDEGRPVFYSWSPDSTRLVACISGDRLSLYTLMRTPESTGTVRGASRPQRRPPRGNPR